MDVDAQGTTQTNAHSRGRRPAEWLVLHEGEEPLFCTHSVAAIWKEPYVNPESCLSFHNFDRSSNKEAKKMQSSSIGLRKELAESGAVRQGERGGDQEAQLQSHGQRGVA